MSFLLVFTSWYLTAASFAQLVDFSQIPQCARHDCFPFHSSSIGCSDFSLSCFCNALTPIKCAAENCSDSDWYAVEDWFDGQCPDPPIVTLGQLPECSRACIRRALIPAYCKTELTRNCFCRLALEDAFKDQGGCLVQGCNETAALADTSLAEFYNETCVYNPTADGNGYDPDGAGNGADGSTQGDQVVDSPTNSNSSPSTNLESIIIPIASICTILTFVGTVYGCVRHRSRRTKHRGHGREHYRRPPPPYSEYHISI